MTLMAVLIVSPIIAIIISICAFIIWIIGIVDLMNQDKIKNRTLWLVIILVCGVVGSVIYLCIRKPNNRKELKKETQQNTENVLESQTYKQIKKDATIIENRIKTPIKESPKL